jgi:hypothetical protein
LRDGSTVWSGRKARLVACITSKNSVMHSDKWEEQFTEFEAHARMPTKVTGLYNWKQNYMINGRNSLTYKIEKENESNEGGTV